MRGAVSAPKRENDEVSVIGPSKFEFGTIKTTKTCTTPFWTKVRKRPQNGVFFNPKSPCDRKPEFCRGWQY